MATVLHPADDDNNNNINVKTNAGRENLTLYAYKKKISLRGSSLINLISACLLGIIYFILSLLYADRQTFT